MSNNISTTNSDTELGNSQNSHNLKKESGSKDQSDGDFIGMTKSLIGNINYKLAILMFIFGFIIFSNLFADKVISKFEGTIENDTVNTKGSIVQLVFYTIGLIIIDLFIKAEII